jgi:hypothetical protein
LKETSISLYFFDYLLFVLSIDILTGELSVSDIKGHFHSPQRFLAAITSNDIHFRKLMRSFVQHSFWSLTFSTGIECLTQFWDNCEGCRQGFVFSFAPEIPILLTNSFSLAISAPRDRISTTSFHMSAETFTKLRITEVFSSLKTFIILLSLDHLLKIEGVAHGLMSDRITFAHEVFDSVIFKIHNSCWRFSFSNEIPFQFTGRFITVRFLDFIVQFLFNITAVISMNRQAVVVSESHTVIRSFDPIAPFGFMLSFIHPFCSNLTISLSPLIDNKGYYSVTSIQIPKVEFKFGRYVQLKRLLIHLLKNRQLLIGFGSFLIASLVPLLHFFNTFSECQNSRDWIIDRLSDDRSFFVVYRRTYSANFLLKPSRVFQMIIPSVGKSTFLHIPLEGLSQYPASARFSHVTVRVTMDKLESFRDAIATFFDNHDALVNVGFTTVRVNDGALICSYPKAVLDVKLYCKLEAHECTVQAEGEGESATAIRALINVNVGNRKIVLAQFVAQLFELDPRILGVVVQFLAALIANAPRIDWGKSVEESKVLASDGKVVMRIIVSGGNSFGVTFRKKSAGTIEIVGSDGRKKTERLKTVRDLIRWIEEMGDQ